MICIIPARAGSKGLANKNMQFLANKPMIYHTIDAAIQSGIFEQIYVSTDSQLYKEIIESERNVKVLLRDASLATDTTPTLPVILSILAPLPDETEFMLCQPTSPLRTHIHILEAYELFEQTKNPVVSVCKADKPVSLFTQLDEGNKLSGLVGVDKNYRRQNAEPMYYPNGAIYISTKQNYVENESFFTQETVAYIMDKKSSMDVDDKCDFINVIGTRFFDYTLREKENFDQFTQAYNDLWEKNQHRVKLPDAKLLFGDSRCVNLKLEKYINLSVSGVTLHTAVQNMDKFITEDVTQVIIALGVNDIIAGHPPEEIVELLQETARKLAAQNIQVIISMIIHTIFRYQGDNNKIARVNGLLLADESLQVINPNAMLCKDNMLLYKYTVDGLHFNESGNQLLEGVYNTVSKIE